MTFQLFDADAALLSDRLAAFAALERFHHEEDVVGSRCRRDFGRFSSLARYAGSRYDYGPGGNPYLRTYPGPGGYPHWSGYADAPVGEPIPPCHWITQRVWDAHGWRERRVRICG